MELQKKRTAKIHNDIATDSTVTFHKETLYTDGTLIKKDSVVHWSPSGVAMKDGKTGGSQSFSKFKIK